MKPLKNYNFNGVMHIITLPNEDDFSMCDRDSYINFSTEDTTVTFKGPGIDWTLPVSQIKSLTARVEK